MDATNSLHCEVLEWINRLLKERYQKLEDLRTGVAYCRLLHLIRPDAIDLNDVNWVPKIKNEYKHNFRVLQSSFCRMGLSIQIPIGRLTKGRFQETINFTHWFKKFFHIANNDNNALSMDQPDNQMSNDIANENSILRNLSSCEKSTNPKKSLKQILENGIQIATWNALVDAVENLVTKKEEPATKIEDELKPQKVQSKTAKQNNSVTSQDAQTQWDASLVYETKATIPSVPFTLNNSQLERNQFLPMLWQKVYGCGSIQMSIHSSIDDIDFREFIESIDRAMTQKIDHMLRKSQKNKSYQFDLKLNNEADLSPNESSRTITGQTETNGQMERSIDREWNEEINVNYNTEDLVDLQYHSNALERDIEHYYAKIGRINEAWKCLLNISPHERSEGVTPTPLCRKGGEVERE